MSYSIIVWHRDDINGLHQTVLVSAITLGKVLRDFDKYMQRPPAMRSFNAVNIVQLHGPNGLMFDIKQIDHYSKE
jgi:hypothetical protein